MNAFETNMVNLMDQMSGNLSDIATELEHLCDIATELEHLVAAVVELRKAVTSFEGTYTGAH